jgi:hypothetical protein
VVDFHLLLFAGFDRRTGNQELRSKIRSLKRLSFFAAQDSCIMGGMKKPKKTPPLPVGTAYGYARVSTDGQSVDAQVRQLTKAGCKKVFREVASGAKTDRAQLRRLLGQLEAGDVLTVTRLDRLARSTRDLLNTLATITGKKAGFRLLGDAWADRVRARPYPGAHQRGPRTGEGARREDGPTAQAHPAPEAGNSSPQGERRGHAGDCPQLQRPQQHDFEAGSMTSGNGRWMIQTS